MKMNRLANSTNPYQGKFKKVLCVCSAGLLRSPTAAFVLSQEPFNFNTRAAGISAEYALIPVDSVLLSWAEEIVCMEAWQANEVSKMLKEEDISDKKIVVLDVDDCYKYRDPQLIDEIRIKYKNALQLEELLRKNEAYLDEQQ